MSFGLYVPILVGRHLLGVRFWGLGAQGNVLEEGVGDLVVERKTTTTEAITSTTVCCFGCVISYLLLETSWGLLVQGWEARGKHTSREE